MITDEQFCTRTLAREQIFGGGPSYKICWRKIFQGFVYYICNLKDIFFEKFEVPTQAHKILSPKRCSDYEH